MKNDFSDNRINKTKILCIVAIVVASVLFVFSFCGRYFSGALRSIANFFVGSLGMSFFGILIAIIMIAGFFLAGKRLTIPKKYIANFAAMYVLIVLVVHFVSSTFLNQLPYGSYVEYCYDFYALPTFGGVVFGTIVYGLMSILTVFGFIALVFILLVGSIFVAVNFLYDFATNRLVLDNEIVNTFKSSSRKTDITPSVQTQNIDERDRAYQEAHAVLFGEKAVSIQNEPVKPTESNISYGTYPYAPQSKLDSSNSQKIDTPINPIDLFFGEPEKEVLQKDKVEKNFFNNAFANGNNDDEDELNEDDLIVNLDFERNNFDSFNKPSSPSKPQDRSAVQKPKLQQKPQPSKPQIDLDATDIFLDDTSDQPLSNFEEDDLLYHSLDNEDDENGYTIVELVEPIGNGLGQARLDVEKSKILKEQAAQVHHYLRYNTPPTDLLDDEVVSVGISQDELMENCSAIVKKLEVFGIRTEAVEPVVGPTVTQYRLRPLSDKIRMNAFSPYADDIKSCLEATGDIRIEAPLQGTNLVGIEVENKQKRPVMLRTLLESREFVHFKGHLAFAIGQDIAGQYIVEDLGKMPHMLVAGTTGSGKSVALNTLIVSMMYKYSPEYLRFIMIDPKFVELSKYNGSPHLLTSEAITSVQDSIAALDYLIKEMNERYVLLRQFKVKHIDDYNARINSKYNQKLPYIVLVVDELADIILQAGKTFETKLAIIAQKARAAGIHIVLSTQRPSKEIVTGVIKANIPCKMALKVSSRINSQIILDTTGAETLVGNGDMLFMDGSSSVLRRIQGCYVSQMEIDNIVEYCKQNNEIYYEEGVEKQIFASKNPQTDENEEKQAKRDEQDGKKHLDSYCKRALYFWLTKNKGLASISSIQRHLSIGFNRAGKIHDSLVAEGYIEDLADSESGNKPRRVLVMLDQLDILFPDQTLADDE